MSAIPEGRISSLYIYPVKSLRGLAVQSAQVTESGLALDRQWALVTQDLHILSQRQQGRLALIGPELTESGLRLSAEGFGSVDVARPAETSAIVNIPVWKDSCPAQLADTDVSQWLSAVLGERQRLRLAYFARPHHRRYHNPQRFAVSGQYFSDAAPYLIANQHSLDALNQRLADDGHRQVDMRHFRPNVVVSGLAAFGEHVVQRVKRDAVRFTMVDHCQRCVMITIDPDTGLRLPNALPFNTLTALNPMPNARAPAFGVNAALTGGHGSTIAVGDELHFA